MYVFIYNFIIITYDIFKLMITIYIIYINSELNSHNYKVNLSLIIYLILNLNILLI